MLFTEAELYTTADGLALLNDAVYLTEDETATSIQTIPVVTNDRYNANLIEFKDITRLSEEYDIDYFDAMEAIIESEHLNPEYTSVVIDEADFILESIEGTMFHEDTIIRPLSPYDDEYQFVLECVDAFLESGDDSFLTLLEATFTKQQIMGLKYNGFTNDEIGDMARRIAHMDQSKAESVFNHAVKVASKHASQRREQQGLGQVGPKNQIPTRVNWGASKGSENQSDWGKDAEEQELIQRMNGMRDKGSLGKNGTGLDAARRNDEFSNEQVRKALTSPKDMGLDANPTDWTQIQAPAPKAPAPKAPAPSPKVSLTRPGSKKRQEPLSMFQRGKNAIAGAPGKFAGAMKGYGNILSGKTQISTGEGKNEKNLTKWQMLKQHAAANKGSTAVAAGLGAAAIGGGIYAYKQYKNKPKSVIGKRIAALRGIYKKFMQQAQSNPQKAGMFKRIAAKILSVIDKLMGYLQNAAG